MATLKFAPGNITVTSGETITFVHDDKTQDPHTLTIVNESDVPSTIDDVFNCGEPGTVCDQVFEQFPQGPPDPGFYNLGGGGAGLDAPLDTLLIAPGSQASATVTAPSGTVLHFICVIHPWMQGTITVK
jgi:plastocyanin